MIYDTVYHFITSRLNFTICNILFSKNAFYSFPFLEKFRILFQLSCLCLTDSIILFVKLELYSHSFFKENFRIVCLHGSGWVFLHLAFWDTGPSVVTFCCIILSGSVTDYENSGWWLVCLLQTSIIYFRIDD